MRNCTRLLGLAVFFVTVVPATCFSQELTPEKATVAIVQALKAQGRDTAGVKVLEIHGCIPASKRSPGDFVCALKVQSPNGASSRELNYFSFRSAKNAWQVLPDEHFDPACAPLDVAQRELRRIRANDSLTVKREVDDGEGSFSDERGMMRDQKGPLRVMCRYEGQEHGSSSEDTLFISYVWFKNGQYSIDNDVEIWRD